MSALAVSIAASPAEALLPRLRNVRKTGTNSWRSDCPNPVHEHGARGGLAIRAADDGALLLHCFACSDTPTILRAVGLTAADLFEHAHVEPTKFGRKLARDEFRRHVWAAALRVLSREATVVVAAAGMVRQGEKLTTDDDARLTLAMRRIDDARAVLL